MIFLDEPTAVLAGDSRVLIKGWYTGNVPCVAVAVQVGPVHLAGQEDDRPDVRQAHPDLYSRGFRCTLDFMRTSFEPAAAPEFLAIHVRLDNFEEATFRIPVEHGWFENLHRKKRDHSPASAPHAGAPEHNRQSLLDGIGPIYHSYALFGVKNRQEPIHESNQKAKAPILQAYIQYAIAKSRSRIADPVTFAELFCADGYYAMVARLFGADRSYGIDNNRDGYFSCAADIALKLGLDGVQFMCMDVSTIDRLAPVSVVANVGGLYHVSNPKEILAKSYRLATTFLIVQSVVSLANDDEEYFETPCPGWPTGCRFNRHSFLKMVRSLGYNIIDEHFNELEGNPRLEDRGSQYLLIRKN